MTEPYISLTVNDYKDQFIETDTPHLLLDVRSQEEYEEVRIPHAVLLPLDELYDRFSEVQQGLPVVVVCRSGMRSAMAIQTLRAVGLTDLTLYNLEGGTMGWQNKGLPTDSGEID